MNDESGLDRLAEDLKEMEDADPHLARLGREIEDWGHYLTTGEERGEVRMIRNRERRLAVMKARRRLWPTRKDQPNE